MSNLALSFASGLYDRMVPLLNRDVRPEGIDLTFVPIDTPGELFPRMHAGEFHAGEVASSEILRWVSAGDTRFVAIPIFPVRVFRHGMIWVNREAGIKVPKDFERKRVGLSQFPQTAALWIRGMFQHEYGVDLATVSWLHEPQFPAPPAVKQKYDIAANHSGKPLDELLVEGEIDAYIGARIAESTHRNPQVRRLFPDFKEREKEYYRRTKMFPIMHTVAIRSDVYEQHPFVAKSLFDALIRSKDVASQKMRYMGTLRYMLPWMIAEIEELEEIFEGDPFIDGLEPNRKTLETTLTYLDEQALLEGPVTLEDTFVDVET